MYLSIKNVFFQQIKKKVTKNGCGRVDAFRLQEKQKT